MIYEVNFTFFPSLPCFYFLLFIFAPSSTIAKSFFQLVISYFLFYYSHFLCTLLILAHLLLIVKLGVGVIFECVDLLPGLFGCFLATPVQSIHYVVDRVTLSQLEGRTHQRMIQKQPKMNYN